MYRTCSRTPTLFLVLRASEINCIIKTQLSSWDCDMVIMWLRWLWLGTCLDNDDHLLSESTKPWKDPQGKESVFWSSEIILTFDRGRRGHESNLQKEHKAGRKAQQSMGAMLLEAVASPRFRGANGKGKKSGHQGLWFRKAEHWMSSSFGNVWNNYFAYSPFFTDAWERYTT